MAQKVININDKYNEIKEVVLPLISVSQDSEAMKEAEQKAKEQLTDILTGFNHEQLIDIVNQSRYEYAKTKNPEDKKFRSRITKYMTTYTPTKQTMEPSISSETQKPVQIQEENENEGWKEFIVGRIEDSEEEKAERKAEERERKKTKAGTPIIKKSASGNAESSFKTAGKGVGKAIAQSFNKIGQVIDKAMTSKKVEKKPVPKKQKPVKKILPPPMVLSSTSSVPDDIKIQMQEMNDLMEGLKKKQEDLTSKKIEFQKEMELIRKNKEALEEALKKPKN